MDQTADRHQRRLPPAARGRTQDRTRDDRLISATLELLAERGYHGLTMTDVATRAGASKATLYRRWTTKADLVADAVDTISPAVSPAYPGTSLRDDLLALLEQAGTCDGRSEVVTATMDMARLDPDLYRTLAGRFSTFIRSELGELARRAVEEGHAPLADLDLDAMSDVVVAHLAHDAGPAGVSVPRERLARLVDHVLLVLLTGVRTR
ncbi:TetR/AcrR family transcriptional regulator [Brevundimonas sp. NIBR11]|uniref:TetR/AcrR family transcriptional regulator n=1 Tax=Brevundimonas sp. NIBR11 TaxID=3015999 RepID=UPI0022F137FD|nr:TetR/AcrR family transcriptional regulator [Brevundimonas sp. NIBR11]WGM30602.1 putative HTH-type transcriptional regulator [Brevundimonas sp. NIBR11]